MAGHSSTEIGAAAAAGMERKGRGQQVRKKDGRKERESNHHHQLKQQQSMLVGWQAVLLAQLQLGLGASLLSNRVVGEGKGLLPPSNLRIGANQQQRGCTSRTLEGAGDGDLRDLGHWDRQIG